MSFTPFTIEKCKSNIKRIKSLGGKLQSLIHLTAVSTLVHVRDHGDWTLAVSLLDALPNGQRVKALAHWYSHFSDGAIKFTYGGAAAGWTCKLAKNRTPEMFNIDGAVATSFADLTAEKSPSTMSLKQAIAYLKRKANDDKLNDDGTPKVSEEARELFAKLYNEATELYPNAI